MKNLKLTVATIALGFCIAACGNGNNANSTYTDSSSISTNPAMQDDTVSSGVGTDTTMNDSGGAATGTSATGTDSSR